MYVGTLNVATLPSSCCTSGRSSAYDEVSDLVFKTRCQILCSMRLQRVSKILTPRRMLRETLLIAKINRWNNSFQNMYGMV